MTSGTPDGVWRITRNGRLPERSGISPNERQCSRAPICSPRQSRSSGDWARARSTTTRRPVDRLERAGVLRANPRRSWTIRSSPTRLSRRREGDHRTHGAWSERIETPRADLDDGTEAAQRTDGRGSEGSYLILTAGTKWSACRATPASARTPCWIAPEPLRRRTAIVRSVSHRRRHMRASGSRTMNTNTPVPRHGGTYCAGASTAISGTRLSREGSIHGLVLEIERLALCGYTTVEQSVTAHYTPVDMVRFQRDYRNLCVGEGDARRVIGVNYATGTAVSESRRGQAIPWRPRRTGGWRGTVEDYCRIDQAARRCSHPLEPE